MKIVFDNIIFSLQKSGGISVYWYEVINRILKQSRVSSFFIEDKEKGLDRTPSFYTSRSIVNLSGSFKYIIAPIYKY